MSKYWKYGSKTCTANIVGGLRFGSKANRCACGCPSYNLRAAYRSYEDGDHSVLIYCPDCGRWAEELGDEINTVEAWNELNDGAAKLTFKIESVPEEITIYSKDPSDVERLIAEELLEKTKLLRVKSGKEET